MTFAMGGGPPAGSMQQPFKTIISHLKQNLLFEAKWKDQEDIMFSETDRGKKKNTV